RLSSLGWKRWAPVQTAVFAAHIMAGIPMMWENKGRMVNQEGVTRLSVIKTAVTLTGALVTLYAGILGQKADRLAEEGAVGATEPAPGASDELKAAQRQLRTLQWIIPFFAGTVIVLGAKHGEMQRPRNALAGLFRS
ncbi:hypothetical protein HER39_09415, partial [Arthrobacter deserti]|nr:hypothetical protein [Arthrobacter deserti]